MRTVLLHVSLLVALLVALAHAAAAAEPVPHRLADPTGDTLLFDVRPGESLWVRGATWKGSFGPDGATFVPFLGSDAPRSWPLAFGAPRVRIGSRPLELATHAAPERDGPSVRFERGAVDEVYLLDAQRVEQRFVVDAPLGDGDVVVEIPLDSELEPRVDGGSLRFANERGGVEYGGATAVDAAGRTLALDRTFTDGAIRIVVPAHFAASARYPLVIDPIVAAFGVFTSTPQVELSPDAAYDATMQQFLSVAEVAFSATDHDVVSLLLERDGTPAPGGAVAVDATDEYWATPRCAGRGLATGFDVVAAIGIPGQSSRSIRSRVRAAGVFLPAVVLSDADDGDNSLPDVGGLDIAASEHWCVAWQSERAGDREVNGRMVNPDGTTSGGIVRISADPAFRDGRPAVSNAGGGDYEVLFEREITPSDRDIHYAVVQNAGVVTHGPAALVAGPTDDTFPAVSDVQGTHVRALIAFQRESGGNANVVLAEHAFGFGLQNLVDVSALDPATAAFEQFTPVVEFDGERYVLAWCERDGAGTRILASEYHVFAGDVKAGLARVPISVPAADAQEPRLAGRFAALGPNLGVVCVWSDDASGSARDVFGARYEPAVGIPARAVCFGDGTGAACPCGNLGAPGHGCANSANAAGGLLAAAGDATMQSDTFVLQGSGMPPNSTCLFFQGTLVNASPPLFGDGQRCATGDTIRLATKLNSPAGASTFPQAGDLAVSVRGMLGAGGGRRYYQGWYRNAAAFCTVTTFNLTNALEVDWTLL